MADHKQITEEFTQTGLVNGVFYIFAQYILIKPDIKHDAIYFVGNVVRTLRMTTMNTNQINDYCKENILAVISMLFDNLNFCMDARNDFG